MTKITWLTLLSSPPAPPAVPQLFQGLAVTLSRILTTKTPWSWVLVNRSICGQSRPNFLEGLPPAGHSAGFKTSFALLYYHASQSGIHKLYSTRRLQHTTHNPYWFATTPEVSPHHPEQLRFCSPSVHTAATGVLYVLQSAPIHQ